MSVTKITISNEPPGIEKCIILGVVNYANGIYIETDDCYYIIYATKKLSNDEMVDILNDDSYTYNFF